MKNLLIIIFFNFLISDTIVTRDGTKIEQCKILYSQNYELYYRKFAEQGTNMIPCVSVRKVLNANNEIINFECKRQRNDFINNSNEIKTNKGTLYFIGNGASASISSHCALDFFKTGKVKTRTFNDLSYLTAISNDISFNEVFSFPLDELGTSEDILFAISSSGNSQNIVNGVDIAIKKGMFVVTFSGMSEDNKIRSMGDINIYFPGQDYGPIECAHSIIIHCIL